MKIHPYVSAVVVAVIFGFSFMFTKNALDFVTPNQLVAFRFLIASILMTILWAVGAVKINLKGRPWGPILALALVQPVLYFFCETKGVDLTTSSEAGLLIALVPVFVTVLGAIFLKEMPTILQVVFILLSVIGVAFIVAGGQKLTASGQILGLLALLGAVLSAAAYNILSRHLSQTFNPTEITFVMMWVGAIVFSLATIIESIKGGKVIDFAGLFKIKELWIAGLYLGVFSSVVAFFGMNYTLSKIEASRNAVFSNLSTVVSVVAGVCFRGEPFFWAHLVGGFLILMGVWGVNRFRAPLRQFSKK